MSDLSAYLQRLERFGTSIEISWGEDDGMWGIVWISGGKKFTALEPTLEQALAAVWLLAALRRNRD